MPRPIEGFVKEHRRVVELAAALFDLAFVFLAERAIDRRRVYRTGPTPTITEKLNVNKARLPEDVQHSRFERKKPRHRDAAFRGSTSGQSRD